jgi:PAS domain S-box-containing protein
MDLLGFMPEELMGKAFMDLIPAALQPATGQKYAAQIAAKIPFLTLATEARHKDGHPVILEIRSTIIHGNDGAITGMRGIARDITDRRRAEEAVKESAERFRTLTDMLPQIIFEMDMAGRIRYANRQAFEMLLVSREDFENGVAALEFIAEQDRARAAADIREAMTGDRKKGDEYHIRRRDGTTFPGLVFSIPIMQGGSLTGLRGMIVDISEQKRMEEALRETGEKLRILTTITRHDIQNKTMILRAYLAQAQQTGDAEKVKDYLTKADSVAQTVEDITTFTKTYEEIGCKEPVWLDLNRIVTDEATSAGMGSCELVLPLQGYEIFVDRLFGRVFYNLIENTLRYGRTATRITVGVHESGDRAVILYEDNGIGIAAEEKERIFEKGVGKGTGLGLFLIRQILAITGITIRETGKPGNGVRFEMAFPPGNVRRRAG